jgi:hypothetical protein
MNDEELKEYYINRKQMEAVSSSVVPTPEPSTDRTREIVEVNTPKAFSIEPLYDKEGNVVGQKINDGDVPLETKYRFYSLLHPWNALSVTHGFQDEEHDDWSVRKILMLDRQSRPRNMFTLADLLEQQQVENLNIAQRRKSRNHLEREATITYAQRNVQGFVQMATNKAKEFFKNTVKGDE